ncbi:MAG: PqqD family protein [Holophagaceae bacterium]|nr:PqqD family protein [Holophagaceae bacterium]
MQPLRPDTILARSAKPLSADLHDETVLMSLESGSYYGLEGTARRIWELLATPRTLSSLGEQLAKEYQVDPGQCAVEIRPFIDEMRREGLLVADP